MGALEYEPSIDIANASDKIDLDALTKLASEILSEKEKIVVYTSTRRKTLQSILVNKERRKPTISKRDR